MVRRLIGRSFALPANSPRVEVSVAFLPEAALYKSGGPPIVEHRVTGGRLGDGRVQLPMRLVGFTEDEPDGRDLAVCVVVEGTQRCLTKAKYPDAKSVGVERGDRLFYIDAVSALA